MPIAQFSEKNEVLDTFQTDGETITMDKDFECKGKLITRGLLDAKNNITAFGSVSSGTGTNNVLLQGGEIIATGQIAAKNMNITSDKRAKLEIEDIDPKMVKSLTQLVPKQYSFVQDKRHLKETHFGFIAQELEEIYPQMVREIGDIKRIDYIELIPLLVSKVNQMEKINRLQEERIKVLEEKIGI